MSNFRQLDIFRTPGVAHNPPFVPPLLCPPDMQNLIRPIIADVIVFCEERANSSPFMQNFYLLLTNGAHTWATAPFTETVQKALAFVIDSQFRAGAPLQTPQRRECVHWVVLCLASLEASQNMQLRRECAQNRDWDDQIETCLREWRDTKAKIDAAMGWMEQAGVRPTAGSGAGGNMGMGPGASGGMGYPGGGMGGHPGMGGQYPGMGGGGYPPNPSGYPPYGGGQYPGGGMGGHPGMGGGHYPPPAGHPGMGGGGHPGMNGYPPQQYGGGNPYYPQHGHPGGGMGYPGGGHNPGHPGMGGMGPGNMQHAGPDQRFPTGGGQAGGGFSDNGMEVHSSRLVDDDEGSDSH